MLSVISVLLVIVLSLSGCSVGYLTNVAYEQSKILLSKEPIDELIKDKEVSDEEADKLSLVLEVREFAKTLGLDPGNSYKKFARIDRDVLSWIVMGSKKDSFTLHTWWFPIVGSVPYKGYFEKADADELAKELEEEGFETRVRPTDAYSTLGWFSDPVLSTMLKRDKVQLANTIIHESVHSTFWFPGYVPFNESLANFIGDMGALEFFKHKYEQHPTVDTLKLYNDARRYQSFDLDLGAVLENLHSGLEALYKSDIPTEEKLIKREEIFNNIVPAFKAKYQKINIFNKINNAEIMQLRIYHTGLDNFFNLYQNSHGNLSQFIEYMHKLSKELDARDPFDAIKRIS